MSRFLLLISGDVIQLRVVISVCLLPVPTHHDASAPWSFA